MPILYAAKKYIIPGLVKICVDYVYCNVSTNTVCNILQESLQLDETSLISECLGLIQKKTQKVFDSESFVAIPDKVLQCILESSTLSVPEVVVFEACVRWCKARCRIEGLNPTVDNQRHILGDLLYLINIEKIPLDDFSRTVVPSGLLHADEELQLFRNMTGCRSPQGVLKFKRHRKMYEKWKILKPRLHDVSNTETIPRYMITAPYNGCWVLSAKEEIDIKEVHMYTSTSHTALLKAAITLQLCSSKTARPVVNYQDYLPVAFWGGAFQQQDHNTCLFSCTSTASNTYTDNNHTVHVFLLADGVHLESSVSYQLEISLKGPFTSVLTQGCKIEDENVKCVPKNENLGHCLALKYKVAV